MFIILIKVFINNIFYPIFYRQSIINKIADIIIILFIVSTYFLTSIFIFIYISIFIVIIIFIIIANHFQAKQLTHLNVLF
jgi:hypothetical protein